MSGCAYYTALHLIGKLALASRLLRPKAPSMPAMEVRAIPLVQRAADGEAAALEDVPFDYAQDAGVDHRRFHVLMAEQLLDGADVVVVLKQVGGKAMAEGVGTDGLGDANGFGGSVDGALDAALVQVVATHGVRTRVHREAVGGEDVLPDPFAAGVGVFAVQGVGQINGAQVFGEILVMEALDALQMLLEGCNQAVGQHRDVVLLAFTIAHSDRAIGKVAVPSLHQGNPGLS